MQLLLVVWMLWPAKRAWTPLNSLDAQGGERTMPLAPRPEGPIFEVMVPPSDETCSVAPSPPTHDPHWQVPVVPMHNLGSEVQCKKKEVLVRLKELQSMEIAVVFYMHMGSLVLADTDPRIAEAMRQISQNLRDELQHKANVISRFSNSAYHVSEYVLKDVLVAVEQKQPKGVSALLNTIGTSLDAMRAGEKDVQSRHADVQGSVQALLSEVQHAKRLADGLLMEASSPAAAPADGDAEPRQEEGLALEVRPAGDVLPPGGVVGECWPNLDPNRLLLPPLSTELARVSGPTTPQQLLQQPKAFAADGAPACGAGQPADSWERYVADLFYVFPGQFGGARLGGNAGAGGCAEDDTACRRHQHLSHMRQQIRRISAILKGSSSFWDAMGWEVQKLADMKDYIVTLASATANASDLNTGLADQLALRLSRYNNSWASLEQLSRQFCDDYHSMSEEADMHVRVYEDAQDLKGSPARRQDY